MKKGFTLIEIMLYVGIMAIVVMAVVALGLVVITNGQKNAWQEETYSAGRFISEKIKYEIRNADGINTGTSNFGVNLVNNPGLKLSLIGTAPNNPVVFDVSSGKARITYGAGAAINLNSVDTTVTDLTFTNNTSVDGKTENITYTLTVTSNYLGTRQEYKATIGFRGSVEVRSN